MSNEPQPFLIEGPEKQRYELTDIDYFVSHYKPQGYRIVDPAPTGYVVPELSSAKAEKPPGVIVNGVNLSAMTRTELNAFAAEHGVPDADKFPNKDALIEAIEAHVNSPMDETA